MTKCDREERVKMVQNSVTYFMDGPLGGQRIRWSAGQEVSRLGGQKVFAAKDSFV